MSCDLGRVLAGTGLLVDLAFAAFLMFGTLAAPLLQSALENYYQAVVGFVDCFLMM